MRRKLAQSLLLMTIVAAMMLGGGMVQEGRREMGNDTTPGISAASEQDSTVDETGSNAEQIVDLISDEIYIRTNTCPQAHKDF